MQISFLAFYLMWADFKGWDVPDIHIRACYWFEHRGELGLLRCFRGFGKSTILAVGNVWRLYTDPEYRILLQSCDDSNAIKVSRETQYVLRNHPLTGGMLPKNQGTVEQWWVNGATDMSNASMRASGILSNVTGGRANECQNDDIEVPKNIQTIESREKLRYRLGEQTHILIPEGKQLFIGTPHTHDSLYDELEEMGADCLTIKLFEYEYRIENANKIKYTIPFRPVYIFSGIGKYSRLLEENEDYILSGNEVTFYDPVNTLVDFYSESSWPERFSRSELSKRRRKTRTVNEWDSQYQLHSKPVEEVRLNPDNLIYFDVDPEIKTANGEVTMWLGFAQIIGASAYWDCSLGKINSDASAFTVVLTDHKGNLYWFISEGLTGELVEYSDDDQLVGGQIKRIVEIVTKWQIPSVTVETNGPGGFVPPILRRALKGTGCAVKEEYATQNKNKRILDGIEPPLSSGFLWAHKNVFESDAIDQMRGFNPAITSQADDYLDSLSGASRQTPVRIGKKVKTFTDKQVYNWKPNSKQHKVKVRY